jgi:hypothetical protein
MLGSPVLFRRITSFSAAAQISADIPLLFRRSQASFTFLNLRRRSSRSFLSRTFITNLLSEQAEEQILTVTLCSPFSSAKQDSAYSFFSISALLTVFPSTQELKKLLRLSSPIQYYRSLFLLSRAMAATKTAITINQMIGYHLIPMFGSGSLETSPMTSIVSPGLSD